MNGEKDRLQHIEALRRSNDIPGLVSMLDESSWAVRRQVVAALAGAGDEAVRALCNVLSDRRETEAQLAAAVDALSASTADAEPRLLALSRHHSAAVVADAAQALGRRRRSAAVPRLTELSQHSDDNVAVAAIEALGRLGGRAAVDALVAATRSGSFFRTFPAVDVLGRSGDPRAIEPLAELLENGLYAMEAARALGRTGDVAALTPLLTLLTDAPSALTRVAAVALADLLHRYEERYGLVDPVEWALRTQAPPHAAQRLTDCLETSDDVEKSAITRVLSTLRDERAAPVLTQLLQDSAPVARAAAEALKRINRDSETELIAALDLADSQRRAILLPVLTRAAAAPSVARCLEDGDPSVRVLACEALARLGEVSVVAALFPLLEDTNPRVTQAATEAIQALGGEQAKALCLRSAKSVNPSVRRAAIRILAYFGWASGVDTLLAAIRDSDERVRDAAINGLPYIEDPRAVQGLLETAKSPDGRARGVAMRALGQCGRDLRVQACLLRGLTDSDAWVRYYASQSLGRLGSEIAAEPIAALLRDPAGHVRVAAVEALSHILVPLAAERLIEAARDVDPDVRRAALIGLGISRPPGSERLVVQAAKEGDVPTRLVALSALPSFGSEVALASLLAAAVDPDESIRTAAVSYLAGLSGVEATLGVVGLLRTSAEPERVLEALLIPMDGRVKGILRALDTADDELSLMLTSTLAKMRRPDATGGLLEIMKRSPPAARRAAASSLAALRTREAINALQTAAQSDSDPQVRSICALLLAR
ncbi:MAG: HEAT repeat domain-containing protein [Myxococcaceae bacterium]